MLSIILRGVKKVALLKSPTQVEFVGNKHVRVIIFLDTFYFQLLTFSVK